MRQLDLAIFDLYELNAAERDLVQEMCAVGLDLFYHNQKSDALGGVAAPKRAVGTLADVYGSKDGLSAYLATFLQNWKVESDPDEEFGWRVLSPPSRAPLLAIAFAKEYNKGALSGKTEDEKNDWQAVLTRLDRLSRVHAKKSALLH